MESDRRVDRAVILLCIAGILASTYALYVELSAEASREYKAFCDFSENAMCSRVLTSKYAKGFGILPFTVPNSVYGVLYYCLMIILTTFNNPVIAQIQLILSGLAVLSSVYLAYLLMFVLHDFCLVCVSTYVINAGLALFSYIRYSSQKEKQD